MSDTYTDAHGIVWANHGEESDDHLGFGGHETHLVEIAASLLPEGGTFLDIGAHVGLYSLNLGRKAGHVYAVEANERTYETLLSNIKANASLLSECQFHSIHMAAWDDFEILVLTDENGKSSGGSTHCDPMPKKSDVSRFDSNLNTVHGMPLDSALPDECMPDLVKIDVEGAEFRVLRGMETVLDRARPVLFIEMHDIAYDMPELRGQVLGFLENAGYVWDDNLSHGGQYYLVAKHPERPEPFTVEVAKAGENPVTLGDAVSNIIRLLKENQ